MQSRSRLLLCILLGTAGPVWCSGTESSPHWIWAKGEHVTLQRSFTLTDRCTATNLQLAADFASCEVRINNRRVAAVDNFGPQLEVDVTEALRTGENNLSLIATGGEGPSAIAAELEVILVDGSRLSIATDHTWHTEDNRRVQTAGRVQPEMWQRRTEVSPFEDYTQWKRALGTEAGTDPATFSTQPGFAIELVRFAAPDEGSWVGLTFDPRGRIVIARENQGLLRMTLSQDSPSIAKVQTINESLRECRGLLFVGNDLYVNANNSKGLYRLRDTNDDDRFDDVRLLREFPGGVGHGRNDLALGSDGMIYSIHGDAVEVPTEEILDRTSPFREARRGTQTTEGVLLRTDPDGERWELISAGLRNPYGLAFTREDDLFTYDADAEHDMGAPWYRPTRIDHLVSGADFGWRGMTGRWPPFDPDQPGHALPVVDVGKGSPTALASGDATNFPPPYRDALFLLDWAYGRILAAHLQPRGAGYTCQVETFLQGRPFNVTDLVVGPDGALYVTTGGRKTQSALYRISHTGEAVESTPPTPHQRAREAYSAQQRALRKRLAGYHGRVAAEAIEVVWPSLGSPDPTLRHAAQVALEHQPVERWKTRALTESNPHRAVTVLLCLARSGQQSLKSELLTRLNQISLDALSEYQRLTLLRGYSLTLAMDGSLTEHLQSTVTRRLLKWYPQAEETVFPTGAGRGVNHRLAELLLIQLRNADAVGPTVRRLKLATTQDDHLHALFVLRAMRKGWSGDDRTVFFRALGELERSAFRGAGMPEFLRQIREQAVATLTDDERTTLADLLEPKSERKPDLPTVKRAFVKKWSVADVTEALAKNDYSPDEDRGRRLFDAALCSRCHRIDGRGGVLGPDLTSVARRFGRADLLTSILTPSQVISEKYRGVQVVTRDGRVITGRVITGGDYRSPTVRIATDPLRPSEYVTLNKAEVEIYQPSSVSPMPAGLLDTFTAEEIADLLSYLSTEKQPHSATADPK